MKVRGPLTRLPDEVNTVLFRVAQESLTNIEKHADAGRVQLRLVFHARGLRMRLIDDGAGFDVPAIRTDPRRGIGLRNMRERVESIGGHFAIVSRPGQTQVLADIPADAIRRFQPVERKVA
jgi:two-component system NarL family sensor kinase